MQSADADAHEKERIELLRELKRVLSVVLEQQHEGAHGALTEDDPSVKELLVWVERCLWHGLRRSFVRGGDNNSDDAKVTLWSLVNVISAYNLETKESSEDEARDLATLKNIRKEVLDMIDIRSDVGKSRAWVRLALNHGILGCLGMMKDIDARTFYEPVSVWRSAEQRSIASALLGSLRGLDFNLKIDPGRFINEPEPSRRPHFLGISSMRVRSPPASAVPLTPAVIPSAETRARQERVNKEREAVEALKGKTGSNSAPVEAAQSVFSWVKGALFGTMEPASAPTETSPSKQPVQSRPRAQPVKRAPQFLGSTISELIMDPRTCDEAILDWRIAVPRAVFALLLLIEVEELTDPFDPRYVAEEDNPKFLNEVAALIRRLSNRESRGLGDSASAAWDGGSPALLAVAALKLFFRQLPVPIIPYEVYDALVACQSIGDLEARVKNIKFLINSIPDAHKPTLLAVINVVGRKCDSNVTTTISAANALAPSLMRPKPGPEGGLGRALEATELVSFLIERRAEIFADIAGENAILKQKLATKLSRIESLHKDFRAQVQWPDDEVEVWMKRAWVALGSGHLPDPGDEEAISRALNGFAPVSEEWIKRGFRTEYMTHDFRGCGLLALKNIVFMAETYPEFTQRMLAKHSTYTAPPKDQQEQMRMQAAEAKLTYQERIQRDEHKSKFPFLLGSAQVSRTVNELLGIGDPAVSKDAPFSAKKLAELSTWPLFDEEDVSGHVFSLAMRLLDIAWVAENAKAMDFNRIRREVLVRLADIIDNRRPKTVNELREWLQRDIPLISEFQPRKEALSSRVRFTPSDDSSMKKETGEMDAVNNARQQRDGSVDSHSSSATTSESFLPKLLFPFQSADKTLLTNTHVAALESALPSEYRGYDWELVFSTNSHGFNPDAFFKQAESHAATLLVISDVETESIFGGFCTEQWANRSDDYYGTGQCFLFTFAGENGTFKDYKWTNANSFFMLSNDDCLAMGQGPTGFGLFIDGDLKQGTSAPCATYGNTSALVKSADEQGFDGSNHEFTCKAIELWTFVPKTVARRRGSSVAAT